MAYYAILRPKGKLEKNTDPDSPNVLFKFDKGHERDLFVHNNADTAVATRTGHAQKIIIRANEYGNNGRTPGDGRRDSRSWNYLDI